jgi:hypothetical protein
MSWPTAVVLIIMFLGIAEVFKTKYRAQGGIVVDHRTGEEQPVARSDPALQREVEELRERVKVLERIATEDRETKLLSAEIDKLRDPQR